MNSYQELTVWQKSIELVVEIYRLTKFFPREEIYGLSDQMKRAVVPIPANIAEGFARKHRKEYAQFARVAFGSGAELETHLIIAKKLYLALIEKFKNAEVLTEEVMRMLIKFISVLVAKP